MKLRKDLLYPVAFVIAAALSIGYKVVASGKLDGVFLWNKKDEVTVGTSMVYEEEPSQDTVENTEETSASSDTVFVYISGAVISPGVYELPRGAIVNDAVTAAGGFTEDAASQRLDLVYVLSENRTIYIPTESEVQSGTPTEILSFDPAEIEGGADATSAANTDAGLININTATSEQLQTLPGIGPATAQAIISYREGTPFTRIEDIMNVQGIGEGRFGTIRDLICVG